MCSSDLDAVVSDHTPHSIEDKEVPFDEAAPGASSLQWLLSLALTDLAIGDTAGAGPVGAAPGPVGLAPLIGALSWGPRAVLTGPAGAGGRVEAGTVADLTVIDPTATWTLDPGRGASRTRTTPFAGRALRGRVRHTIVGGVPVVIDAVAQR